MTLPSTTIAEFTSRAVSLFPASWAAPEATEEGGGLYAILKSDATNSYAVSEQLQTAQDQANLLTATGEGLDSWSKDFYGDRLPRRTGESDAHYRTRLTVRFMSVVGTAAAISDAIEAVTGQAPTIRQNNNRYGTSGGFVEYATPVPVETLATTAQWNTGTLTGVLGATDRLTLVNGTAPTFSRATAATKMDFTSVASGDPRYEAGPAGSDYSVMIEATATQRALWSEDFSNAAWTKLELGVTLASGTAPDGTNTMNNCVPTTANAEHYVEQATAHGSSTGNKCNSVYAKANGYDWISIQVTTSSGAQTAWFNVSTGTVGTRGASVGTAQCGVEAMGGGVYRCWVRVTTTSRPIRIRVCSADNQTSFAGDGTSGVLLWGAQAENNLTPTSYLKTTTAIVTRNAELLTIPRTVLNPAEGAFLMTFYSGNDIGAAAGPVESRSLIGSLLNGANDIYMIQGSSSTSMTVRDASNNAYAATYTGNPFAGAPAWYTVMGIWKTGELSLWVNGTKIAVQNTVVLPSAVPATYDIGIGHRPSATTSFFLQSLVAQVDIFNKAPTDVEAAAWSLNYAGAPTLSSKHAYQLRFENNLNVTAVGGHRVSASYPLDSYGTLQSSDIRWQTNTLPTGAAVLVETSVDDGVTWSSEVTETTVAGATGSGVGKDLRIRETLYTNDPAALPELLNIETKINHQHPTLTSGPNGSLAYDEAGEWLREWAPYQAFIDVQQREQDHEDFLTAAEIYALITSLKPIHTTMWVRITGPDDNGGIPV